MTTLEHVRDWYDRRFERQGADAFRPVEAYPRFLDLLKAQAGKTLLDVGCGSGYVLAAASRRNLKTIGTDISPAAIALAQRISPSSKLVVCPGETLKVENGVADYVICLGALEHFLDMDRGLQEMQRVTKPLARLLIMVPNKDFFLWKLKRQAGTEQQDISEHLLTVAEWRSLFARNGLVIERVGQDRWPMQRPKLLADRHPVRIFKRLVYKIVWAVLPTRWCYQPIFIMHKASSST